RHDGCGETGASTDLQQAMAGLDGERGDDLRLQVGSLNRLAAIDRDHALRPGDALPALRHEGMARRRLEGRDQILGDDALAPQSQQEGGEGFAAVRHIFSGHFVHASAFVSWSRSACAVRSNWSGVTETKLLFTAWISVPSRRSVVSRPKRSQ